MDTLDPEHLLDELANFEDIARNLLPQPGDVPRLRGIDVWGGTLPLNGVVGGDHIVYVDFKRRFDLDARIAIAQAAGQSEVAEHLTRCRHMAGIAIVDVSGHRVTDALLAAMLHQAFLVGALYELEMSGRITPRLFENLNTRFFQSSGAHKYVSMIYGEISEDARFRFLSAGHVPPVVFSRAHDCFMHVDERHRRSCPPLGMMPSRDVVDRNAARGHPLGFKDRYEMNHWQLMGAGDILVLHTDGPVRSRQRRCAVLSATPGAATPCGEGQERPRYFRGNRDGCPCVRPALRRYQPRDREARTLIPVQCLFQSRRRKGRMQRQSFEVTGLEHENPIPAVCRKGNILISSGIFGAVPAPGVSAKERKVPPTIEEEAGQMFRNMQTVIEAAGGTVRDIVSVSIWVTDRAYKPLVNKPWLEMFPDPHSRPTRDTDEVPKLSHGCRMRCKFMAVV